MSISLIGIIFVQGYWIKNSVESSEEQFSISAKQILINVGRTVENEELDKYYFEVAAMADSVDALQTQLSELFHLKDKNESSEYYVYSNSILQEDYKVSSPFLFGDKDSIEFRKLVNRKVTRVVRKDGVDKNQLSAMDRYERIQKMDKEERYLMRDAIQEGASMLPIHQRVDAEHLNLLIEEQLKQRNLTSQFEYGIYSNDLPTKVRSDNFVLNSPSTYGVPIFQSKNKNDNYKFFINFTDKNKAILSSISKMAIISIIFTIIIVLTFSSAISQLFRQRQISEIKTDFINNMTHEFKTPIATINLALDSMNNPKVGENKEMMSRYLKMIRDENKRMHAQVENVLRISKLERNELDIDKDRQKLHDLIDRAIGHVDLIVKNRSGYIKKQLDANKSSILASESHFTNLIVNVLDNAIKYSPDTPKIDIETENVKNFVILKITDHGAGMSKAVQKKIFDKFYREHTGDVHNVKGHGLGLVYVKRIVEDHHGEISVESEKGVGSSFIIKLPLIS
jgi:two-component system phosphate regulon sensor histidine kinase PhoR